MLPKEKESILIKSIAPSYRINDGEGLALWQEKARKKLSELLGLDRFDACENTVSVDFDQRREGFREIRFRVQTEKDLFVPCHLLIPEGTDGNAPLMICLQGHSTGMHLSLGKALYEAAADLARREGCYNLTLNVWSCNEGAMAFYKSCGLVPQKVGMEKIL